MIGEYWLDTPAGIAVVCVIAAVVLTLGWFLAIKPWLAERRRRRSSGK